MDFIGSEIYNIEDYEMFLMGVGNHEQKIGEILLFSINSSLGVNHVFDRLQFKSRSQDKRKTKSKQSD